MKTEQEITDTIMRRVRVVHARRALLSPRTRFVALLAVCFALAVSVSVKNVVLNAFAAATSWSSFFLFVQSALASTEFFVQLSLLGALVLAGFSIRDFCGYCITHHVFAFFRRAREA